MGWDVDQSPERGAPAPDFRLDRVVAFGDRCVGLLDQSTSLYTLVLIFSFLFSRPVVHRRLNLRSLLGIHTTPNRCSITIDHRPAGPIDRRIISVDGQTNIAASGSPLLFSSSLSQHDRLKSKPGPQDGSYHIPTRRLLLPTTLDFQTICRTTRGATWGCAGVTEEDWIDQWAGRCEDDWAVEDWADYRQRQFR